MAPSDEIQQVLANWISQATDGRIVSGVEHSQWIAANFLKWWRNEVKGDVEDAEAAIFAVRAELVRLAGWENPKLGEAMHELTHADEAIASLKSTLGLTPEPPPSRD